MIMMMMMSIEMMRLVKVMRSLSIKCNVKKFWKKIINLNLTDFKEFENTWYWLRSCDRMNTTKKYQNTKDNWIKSCSKFPVSDLRWHPRVEGQGLLMYLDRASMVPDAILRRHHHTGSFYVWSESINGQTQPSHCGHKVPTADSAGAHLGVVSVSVSGMLGSIGGRGALSLAWAGLGHILSQVAAGVVHTVAVAL